MAKTRIKRKDLILELSSILQNHQWKYGYQISMELRKLNCLKYEFYPYIIYPILIYLENEGIIQTKKEWVNNRNRIFYKLKK